MFQRHPKSNSPPTELLSSDDKREDNILHLEILGQKKKEKERNAKRKSLVSLILK